MKPITVSYSRLVNTGDYENEKVGIVVEIEPGENADTALSTAKVWVDAQLKARQIIADQNSTVDDLEYRIGNLKANLKTAKETWEKAKAFLLAHGLSVDDCPGDLPF